MAGLAAARRNTRSRYTPPENLQTTTLAELLAGYRKVEAKQQGRLVLEPEDDRPPHVQLWVAGDQELIRRPAVAIVGTRNASAEGRARASRLARELVEAGVTVVSGLAKGIDAAAHTAAIEAGGATVAVIGTPLERAYPAENAALQERIYTDHLLVSQFAPGTKTFPSMFPQRNKLMAALTDATVVIEAGASSGTVHQAAECGRLGRWLFMAKSLVDNTDVEWTDGFVDQPYARVLTKTSDILDVIPGVDDAASR